MSKKVLITQRKSAIRRNKKQLLTLQALGLGKIGRSVEHPLTDSISGMLTAVGHLVDVREAK